MGAPAVGDIVLVPFPFADLTGRKLRPALVAATAERGDIVLCQITSRPWGHDSAIPVLGTAASDGGLGRDSYLRPDKLFTADPRIVVRRLGSLESSLTAAARRATAALFLDGG